jgi:hypothetical protein
MALGRQIDWAVAGAMPPRNADQHTPIIKGAISQRLWEHHIRRGVKCPGPLSDEVAQRCKTLVAWPDRATPP